ncbi:Ig-like domain-containing protein, partial [Flavobacterium sp.]|uniref:Ig-like domain-containing protein n=1 Tax=Flavobacterium sp. TaxID=239 RepID=UPI002FDC9BBD
MIKNYFLVKPFTFMGSTSLKKEKVASFSSEKKGVFSLLFLFFTLFSFAQVTTNSSSGLAATYPSLASAITALNGATITDPVVITLTGNETAPVGGYSITATGTSTNTITIQGNSSTITAPAQTSGNLNDAIFKIIGGDWITIQGFTLNERAFTPVAADTAAGTNTMTEWGIALLYATTTNGAQNCTIQNNIIALNRTYQNTFGIYSNSTHSATTIATSATATTTAGGNSGLKVYGNTINNVNLGIVVVGPTAAADANTGIDIGGSSISTGNTISNFGTTGTFSGYANVSGTVNGILVRNSNGFNVSYNSITSSDGGVTTGTLNGIQIQASSNAPTTTFTNTISYNAISLQSGAATGAINGITYPSGSASVTSIANVSNNNFTRLNHSVVSSGAITALSKASGDFTTNISNNTFTNISCSTTGSFTFISHSVTMPTGGSQTISGNSIVTGFTKTGAGGTVTCLTSAGSSVNGTTATITNNNFSNITITGATAITAISSTDYLSSSSIPTKIITNNTFNSWIGTGGTSAYIGLTASYWAGNSTVNNNTFTNWSGQGAITAINLGSTGSIATSISIANNIINNLSSTGTGGQVLGISCSNTSTLININGNTINTLSSTGASSAVGGILVSGASTTNVYQNTIYGMLSSGITSPLALGISIQGGTNVNTYRNKIYNISATANISTTSPAVIGINITAGSNINTYNNLIADLTAPLANLTDAIRGVNITSTATSSNQRIYNNTIYLNASSSGANFGTTGIFHTANSTATIAVLDLQNNMIFNTSASAGTGLTVAYRRGGTALANYASTSNKNLFYVGSPSATNLIMYDGTNSYQTMTTFQAAVASRETGSFTESSFNPVSYFVSTAGSNTNYLKPSTGLITQAESGGNILGSPYNEDYSGIPRPAGAGSSYDVGAWEFEGVSPAPIITNMIATPALTSQCVKSNRAISVDVTTTAGTITSVVLNYSHNGTAQTAITMTNSGGNTWVGTMLAPTIGNANVTWSITATNSIGLNTTYNGVSYSDEPNTGLTTSANASVSTVCAGGATTLTMNINGSGTAQIGNATTLTSATTQPTAFCNRWPSYRIQTIYTAAELTAGGLAAGNINSMAFNITSLGDAATNANFIVRIGTISQSTFSSTTWLAPTFTTVFPAATYTHTASGWQTINFATPYNWDGTSNLIIDIQYDGANATNNAITYFTATTGNTVLHSDTNGKAAASGVLSTTRLNVQFSGIISRTATSYSWSNGVSVVGTSNPLVVNPNVTTTYTGTALVNGCPLTASTTVNVNPLPTAPTATNSAQCGTQIPTASVVDANGFTTPTFNWYAGATGGTALQSSTSTTYTTAISTTTTLYVSVVNPTTSCESLRTPITITVSTPDLISASTSAATICLGQSAVLTAANTASTPLQNYTYSWLSTTGSGVETSQSGASITVTPTAIGTYTYTATAIDGGCQTTNTVIVTVNPLPSITTVTASPMVACAGSTINLAASIIENGPGSKTLGLGASTSTSAAANPFYGGYGGVKTQYLIRASELTALGIIAGDITSLGINVTVAGSTLSGFRVNMESTPLTSLTSNIENVSNNVFAGTFVPAVGINTITFSSPFNWDGTSNIILSFCWSNANTSNTASTVRVDSTPFVSANARYVDSRTASEVCGYSGSSLPSGWNGSSTTSSTRPQFIFSGRVNDSNTTSSYTWSWSDGTSTVLTSSSGSVTLPAGPSTTYTVTATNPSTGCSAAQNVVVSTNVTALAVTTTPSSSNICVGSSVVLTASPTGGCIPYSYSWSDGTSVVGTSSTLTVSPTINTNYTVTITDNTGATVTATSNITINNPQPSSVIGDTKCATAATFNLNATASNVNNVLNWYAAVTGGSSLATGASYTTPSISTTTTYYVEENEISNQTNGLGRVSTIATANTTPSTYGLVFDLSRKAKLNSVDVYLASATSGSIVLQLQNSAGTVINTKTVNVPAGNATSPVQFTLPIDFIIPAGTGYRLLAVSGPAMVRESSLGGFPYSLGTFGNITNGYISGNSTTYYYFYNWSLSNVCSGTRVPVVATLNTPPVITLSNTSSSICNGDSALLTLTNGGASYDTFVWSPSTNVTGNSTTGWEFSPTTTTTYTLTASQSAGSCSTTATYTVTVNPLPSDLTFTPSDPTICVDAIQSITVSGGSLAVTGKLGSGTSTNTSSTPFRGFYGGSKTQALYTSAELTALGLTAGQRISSIGFVALSGTPLALNNFAINAGFVSNTTIGTSFINGATNVVLAPTNYTPTTGIGNLDFILSTPLTWDGVSSLLIETCFNNNNGGGVSANSISVESSTVASGLNLYLSQDNNATVCTNTDAPTTTTNRPNLRVSAIAPVNITWSPITNLFTNASATIPYTAGTNASTVYVKSSTAGVYTYEATATVAATGCANGAAVSVTVNPNNTASTASSTPTVCVNTAISAITHTTTGATGIGTATGLPAGVSATWALNTITISGTPSVAGTFNYSIPLT